MALVILTCLLLITLDRSGNPVTTGARSVFDRLLRPVDIAAETVVLPLERAWYGITRYEDLERENAALRDQIAHMKGSDIEARAAVLQYRELLKLGQLTSKWAFSTVIAEVVGDSPSNFQQTIEISVGSESGVQVGMPVTDGAGLIGRVTRVFPARSVVLLITDPRFAVSARVLSSDDDVLTSDSIPALPPLTSDPASDGTDDELPAIVRETGTVEGRGGDEPLVLRFTDSTTSVSSVRIGAVVDTAGGANSLAPQGVPIGRISAIVQQTGSSSAIVEVTPNADLRRLNFVAVVLYLPNQQAIGR